MLLVRCWVGAKEGPRRLGSPRVTLELLVLRCSREKSHPWKTGSAGWGCGNQGESRARRQVLAGPCCFSWSRKEEVASEFLSMLFSAFKEPEEPMRTPSWDLSIEVAAETKEEKRRGHSWLLRASQRHSSGGSGKHGNSQFLETSIVRNVIENFQLKVVNWIHNILLFLIRSHWNDRKRGINPQGQRIQREQISRPWHLEAPMPNGWVSTRSLAVKPRRPQAPSKHTELLITFVGLHFQMDNQR